MATTRNTVPARTARVRKPAAQYPVRRVLTANVATGETCAIPGLRFTLAEIQECITHRETSGTVQLYCETCGESVADCPELRGKLRNVPAEWSWEFHVGTEEG